MKPSKSLANVIVNDTVTAVPASTDLIAFAPLPNVPLVTPAKHCTIAALVAGGGGIQGTIAVTQVAFGSGPNAIAGNAGFTFVTATGLLTLPGQLTHAASTTARAQMNLPTGPAPSVPVDGDVWREDNTNTGLKIRVAGVTKTIVLA